MYVIVLLVFGKIDGRESIFINVQLARMRAGRVKIIWCERRVCGDWFGFAVEKVGLWGSECHEICKSKEGGGGLGSIRPAKWAALSRGGSNFCPFLRSVLRDIKIGLARSLARACNLCVPLSAVFQEQTRVNKHTHGVIAGWENCGSWGWFLPVCSFPSLPMQRSMVISIY